MVVASKPQVAWRLALRRGLIVGAIAKSMFALVPFAFRGAMPPQENVINTARFAIFMALWCGGTRALMKFLPPVLAGALGAGALAVSDFADRRILALYVGARALASLVRALAARGLLPSFSDAIVSIPVMGIIQAILVYALVYQPDCVPEGWKSYGRGLIGNVDERACRLVAADMAGEPLPATDLTSYADTLSANDAVKLVDTSAAMRPGGGRIHYCTCMHPRQTCSQFAVRDVGAKVFKTSFKMYFIYEAVVGMIRVMSLKKSGAAVDLLGELMTAVGNCTRSCTYVAASSAVAVAAQCFLHRVVRIEDKEELRPRWRALCSAGMGASGLTMAIEEPSVRMPTAMFQAPRALECLVNMARRFQLCDTVTELPNGEVYCFMAASGILAHCFASNSGMSSTVSGLLSFVWGGAMP